MALIVCATRGGEGSRAAQLQAIHLARTEKQRLTFLYVVDVSQAVEYDAILEGAVRSEFHWLGRVLLQIARQRAERAGLDAEVVVLEGAVKEEIENYLQRERASMLVIGASRGTSSHFGDDAVEQFASDIERDTGVPVTVVRPEDYERLLTEIRY